MGLLETLLIIVIIFLVAYYLWKLFFPSQPAQYFTVNSRIKNIDEECRNEECRI